MTSGLNGRSKSGEKNPAPVSLFMRKFLRLRRSYHQASARFQDALRRYEQGKISATVCLPLAEAARDAAAMYEAALRRLLDPDSSADLQLTKAASR